MDYDILSPTDDWIFKLLFGDERDKSLLIGLLKSFVELPEEEYELTFLDTHLKPETEDGKLGIIDVKVRTKTGKIMDIEIQVNPSRDIGKRLSFYKSMLIVEQIAQSEQYNVIQRVICICITDFILFTEEKDYLNNFVFMNPRNGLCFKDIPEEVYTLELPKVPAEDDGTEVWEWMRFLRAKRKEEFEMAAVKNPEIRKAVDRLYELSADGKVRAEYEMRQKARRDWLWQLDSARQDGMEKGKVETARNALAEGLPMGTISKITGLSPEQIAKI